MIEFRQITSPATTVVKTAYKIVLCKNKFNPINNQASAMFAENPVAVFLRSIGPMNI
jgi:hypothetical protein